LTVKLLNLLYLEHEVTILISCVPQSVQKVKIRKFNKPYRIMKQKNELLNIDYLSHILYIISYEI